MFNRIRLVATREFLTTVTSKGFLIGVFVMPLIGLALTFAIPKIMAQRGAQITVEVALIESSGTLADTLRRELDPEVIIARRNAGRRAAMEQAAPGTGDMAEKAPTPQLTVPKFIVKVLPAGSTADAEKGWLTAQDIGERARRALLVVPPEAITQASPGTDYGLYQLYAPRNLPEDAEDMLQDAMRVTLTTERLRAGGLDPALVQKATHVPQPRTVVVAPDGRRQAPAGLNRALPFIMGILLFMGVMIGGQALMTSTIEEKSSRVVEVLLAAVSPLELMWGKLLGQLGVGLVMMSVYITLGVLALMQFAMFGLLDPLLILWLLVFFLVAYLVFGALMLAIGAAVSQLADAQSLMGPVMMLLITPYILTPFIGRQPDSTFSVVASFIPPISPFVILARLASSSPPPVWQVLLSLAVSVGGACIAVWFAAKVFRIGLLLHGKPPSFGTLIKWARMS
ncbi:MAG: ABC transporter permease [Proteobacteria bacterium]|nr:ABC transporter permease [Pseudomonadota bacterium]MCC6632556.1 ABC transporter permease [Gammaproteobacteria bacterium]